MKVRGPHMLMTSFHIISSFQACGKIIKKKNSNQRNCGAFLLNKLNTMEEVQPPHVNNSLIYFFLF